jgi:uncharacterized protein
MSDPSKVLGFLDVTGPWDPSLALVMAGAIAVGAVGFAFTRKRATSMLGLPMQLPATAGVDRRLTIGAAAFGVGWGLVGFCPGPALAAISTGSREAIVFVVAMLAGMALFEWGDRGADGQATRSGGDC